MLPQQVPTTMDSQASSGGSGGSRKRGRDDDKKRKRHEGRATSSSSQGAAGYASSSSDSNEGSQERERRIRTKLSGVFNNIDTVGYETFAYNNKTNLPIQAEDRKYEPIAAFDASKVGKYTGQGNEGIVCEYGQGNKWVVKFWEPTLEKRDEEDVLVMQYYYGRNAARHVGKQTYENENYDTTIMIRLPGETVTVAKNSNNAHLHEKWVEAKRESVKDLCYELASKHAILGGFSTDDYIFDRNTLKINPIDLGGTKFYSDFDETVEKEFEQCAITLYKKLIKNE